MRVVVAGAVVALLGLASWIIALGEVVNLFSILCRRIGLTRGLPFVILCMAAGKIAGSLYYFASGFQ